MNGKKKKGIDIRGKGVISLSSFKESDFIAEKEEKKHCWDNLVLSKRTWQTA